MRALYFTRFVISCSMSKGSQTRAGIVERAFRQASVVGLESLSLGPLAESLQLSKSGLFAHFKSKEALQLEVVQTAIERFMRDVVIPSRRQTDPMAELETFFTRWLTSIKSEEDYGGCLLITMAQEYHDRPGVIRDRVSQSQKDLRRHLADIVRRGIKEGRFRPNADPDLSAFELHGLALSYQYAANLLDDPKARKRALLGMRRLLDDLSA